MIVKALGGETLPVYGRGEQVRDWLHVDDHVRALQAVFERGRPGRTYNVGGNSEMRNIDVVGAVCAELDQLRLRADGQSHATRIGFVADRPGHDARYAIDATRIRDELGWTPAETFASGIARTARWYLHHEHWWRARSSRSAGRTSGAGSPVEGRARHRRIGAGRRRATEPGLADGWRVVAPGRDELDLADPHALAAFVRAHRPAVVINAAAYTAVDRAESDPRAAWRVNALAPAALAAACRDTDTRMIQLSTDYVFDGRKQGAWEVDDPVAPLGVYGASKLGGELAVRAAYPRQVILRTAWVVSAGGSNFVRTMLRLAAERDRVRVVADQHGSPAVATDLAAALQRIALRLADDPAAPTGTFHFSNPGATTWAAFAETIFAGSARRGGPTAGVDAITTADYPTPARHPADSLLSHAAIEPAYGITPRPWRDALDEIVDVAVGPAKEPRA